MRCLKLFAFCNFTLSSCRLVSAYRNKIQGDENYRSHIWPDMIRKYRRGVNNGTVLDGQRPTFREFALSASDEARRCLGRARPSCLQKIDVHWQPHHDRCAPCNMKYDVIAKVSLNRRAGRIRPKLHC